MRTLIPVRKSDRAFTLVELVVVILIVILLIAILLPPLSPRHHGGTRQLKDSTQIRGVHQGMVLWAQNNQDRYPIPSDIDKDDATIKLAEGADPESKNTTANIISIMIYNGYFSPELCVSPAEANADIRAYDHYLYSEPVAAANPKKALWDPAFTADFTTKSKSATAPSGFSYAHGMPHGERLKEWSNTFVATQPIVGNRGPEIASVAKASKPSSLGKGVAGDVTVNMKIPNSKTLLIHGGRTTWEGNIAYNDNHVNFETTMAPETVVYSDGKNFWRDCLFFEEADHPTGRDAFLGVFTRAGAKKSDWKMIWD